MFAYCENNFVNGIDPAGDDVWWLQDFTKVALQGHTSLLIQEKPGHWWYFFWGMRQIRLIHIATCTLDELNSILRNNKDHRGKAYYNGIYHKYIKILGNFYGSLEYIAFLLNFRFEVIKNNRDGNLYGDSSYSNSEYDLFKNNCMQVSVDALSVGYFYSYENTYKKALEFTRLYTIPNEAYDFMRSTVRCTQIYGNNSYNYDWEIFKNLHFKKSSKNGYLVKTRGVSKMNIKKKSI